MTKHWYDQKPTTGTLTGSRQGGVVVLGSQPPPPAALKEFRELFRGGRWVPLIRAKRICKRYRINDFSAFEYLKVAESDHGLWGCIPDENTPTLPPDEQAVLSGLHPRSSLPPEIRRGGGRPANYEPERVAVVS